MNFELIFDMLFKLAAFGCIAVILFFMFKKVEEKTPEPFKEVVSWLRLFVILIFCVMAIYFIADMAGIGTSGNMQLSKP